MTWEAGLTLDFLGCAYQDKSIVNNSPESPPILSKILFQIDFYVFLLRDGEQCPNVKF